MAYATQAQIQMAAGGADKFLELADWNGDGSVDTDVIAEAQSRADGWIDGYLVRYGTPIEQPSDTLIRLAADEAVYWLRQSRGMLAMYPEAVEARKDRERQLEEMRDGKIRPGYPLPAKSTSVVAAVVDNCGPISREGLKGSIW